MKRQILTIGLVIALFAGFNLSMYQLLTRRLSNNFSDVTQAQMVDVGRYLPHTDGSDLPKIDTSLKLTGDLPVLDGAAALVPVYAAVIDTLYPEGCVTYQGGEVVFNEINTIPGFTSISMYPKLFEASGIPCPDLIDQLLECAMEAAN